MVIEADESDGSFLRLDGTIAVVTNIDPEHLDHYGSFDGVKDAFVEFIENVPFYGAAVLCLDHPEVQAVIAGPRPPRRHLRLLGQADFRADNVAVPRRQSHSTRSLRTRRHALDDRGRRAADAGRHNVQNALAAIGVAASWASDEAIARGVRASSTA